MHGRKIYVRDLRERRQQDRSADELVAGKEGLGKEITVGDINRPGLGLAGFFDFFAYDRIQIFGLETAFIAALRPSEGRGFRKVLFF
jgi:HPr kinase/phosphorylase